MDKCNFKKETFFSLIHTWTCSLEENQKRDKIKDNWCKENNIHLIRIPYTYLDSIKVKDLLLESNFLLF